MRRMTVSARALVPLLAPLLMSAPLGAAELVVRDFTFGLESDPTAFHYQLTSQTGTRSGNDNFTNGYGVYLGTLWSFAGPGDSTGFLLGGQITYDRYGYANGGGYTTYGGRVLGGYAYALSDRWTLQGLVDVGIGAGTLQVNGQKAFSSYSATGLNYAYAARLGVSFSVNDTLLIDGDVGYRDISSSLSAGSTDLKLTSTGLCGSLGLRWRFSSSPAPLE
jgi:hypothetical protein